MLDLVEVTKPDNGVERAPDGQRTVLVIGDWIIDENWIVSKHNAFNSSHTGDTHYISRYNSTQANITTLCGVPKIIEVLRLEDKADKKPDYKIIGFGIWNKDDNSSMHCMLCPDYSNKIRFNLYNLSGIKAPKKDEKGRRICPYSEKICENRPEIYNLTNDDVFSTNQIVRIYEDKGGKLHQLSRYDWELSTDDIKINVDLINSVVKNNKIEAVVIQDHNKGVITDNTIIQLLKALEGQDPHWYVRTKVDDPAWLKTLIDHLKDKDKDKKIRLRTVDYKIAQKEGQRLFSYESELGRASLELLGKYTGDDKYTDGKLVETEPAGHHTERVAILFDYNTAIAKDGKECYNYYASPGTRQKVNVGRTTIFFASLVRQDLLDHSKGFKDQCHMALNHAFEWSKNASGEDGDETPLYGDLKKVFRIKDAKGKCNIENYDDSWSRWNQSSNHLGIIEAPNKKQAFQIWRGEGSIKGYICAGGPKRDEINKMLVSLDQYNQIKDPEYPLNCLLVASPGWGKTFLAKSIADVLKLHFMEFSMSQMASTTDLVECFDSICSYQNMYKDKLMIFMDEVNCDIQGSPALGLLLGPTWDGSFTKSGRQYKLKPAIWVFASTASINKLIDENKGADYISRLNGPVVHLDLFDHSQECLSKKMDDFKNDLVMNRGNKTKHKSAYHDIILSENEEYENLSSQIRLDQVYIGVSLLNQVWGPIEEIEKKVLQLFYDIIPVNGFRSLQFFVHKFKNIQKRRVSYDANVPKLKEFPELRRHVYWPDDWEQEPCGLKRLGDYIHIESSVKSKNE